MDSLAQDVRFAFRMMMRNPGLTLLVVVTLGVGIAAPTSIFTMVNTILLRPLPVDNPQELVAVATRDNHIEIPHGLSFLDIRDYREQSEVLTDLIAYVPSPVNLSTDVRADRVWVEIVTANYFTMLGVQPALGRFFLPEEDRVPGAAPYIVLGYELWQDRFEASPAIVGQSVTLNGFPLTVIGVAPREFHSTENILGVQAYIPLSIIGQLGLGADTLEDRGAHVLRVLGRLKQGVTVEQASLALNAQAQRLAEEYPETNRGVSLLVMPEVYARPEPGTGQWFRPATALFLLLAAFILLIASANVANLLLARATTRSKEIAIRSALGAGPLRMARMLLTESVVMALLGAVVALILTLWNSDTMSALARQSAVNVPVRLDLSVDWRVLIFAALSAFVAGGVAGLAPAWRTFRSDLAETLKEGGRTARSGPSRQWLRAGLVTLQVAVSLCLLVGAGLFVRSLSNAQDTDLGFRKDSLLLLSVDPLLQRYDDVRRHDYYRTVRERVEVLPGVEDAFWSSFIPFDGGSQGLGLGRITIRGREVADSSESPSVFTMSVDAGYFEGFGVSILEGRGITEQDDRDSRPVVVVSQTAARTYWPGESPLGSMVSINGPDGPFAEVVGVARDIKIFLLWEAGRPLVFSSLRQTDPASAALFVRTAGPPAEFSQSVGEVFRQLDPQMPVYGVKTLENHLQDGNAFLPFRLGAILAGLFGLVGLLLASSGLYGVVSYAVSQRTHEFGVRLTMGASPGGILLLVFRQTAWLLSLGIVAGLALSLLLARALAGFLLGVGPMDLLTYGGVLLILTLVTVLASYVPARRATRVDPMVALRYE